MLINADQIKSILESTDLKKGKFESEFAFKKRVLIHNGLEFTRAELKHILRKSETKNT